MAIVVRCGDVLNVTAARVSGELEVKLNSQSLMRLQGAHEERRSRTRGFRPGRNYVLVSLAGLGNQKFSADVEIKVVRADSSEIHLGVFCYRQFDERTTEGDEIVFEATG